MPYEIEVAHPASDAFSARLLADWRDVLFVHYAIDPALLQPHMPFDLDLFDGKAWVTLVAFTQVGLRPALGGRLTAWTMRPVATHGFLNLRTYVNVQGRRAIYFIAEWIPNRLAYLVGPRLYGLPFHLGRLDYSADQRRSRGSPRKSAAPRATGRWIIFSWSATPPSQAATAAIACSRSATGPGWRIR